MWCKAYMDTSIHRFHFLYDQTFSVVHVGCYFSQNVLEIILPPQKLQTLCDCYNYRITDVSHENRLAKLKWMVNNLFQSNLFLRSTFGLVYSRTDQVKFVKDSL